MIGNDTLKSQGPPCQGTIVCAILEPFDNGASFKAVPIA